IRGYTPNQAAGMVGNAMHESGLNHLIDSSFPGENSTGLFQHNAARAAGFRRQAMEAFAGQKFTGFYKKGNREYWTDGPGAFTQMAFAVAEMEGTAGNGHRDRGAERAGREFKDNPNISVAEAAKIFQNEFEN